MLSTYNIVITVILSVLSMILVSLLSYVCRKKRKKQLDKIFIIIFILFIFWMLGLILQIICTNLFGANPIYFDYFVYIAICFMPVTILILSLVFAKTKIIFTKKYLLLFIIPLLSLILLWTNDFHHLFYKVYSINYYDTVYGSYMYIHSAYTYILFAVSIIILLRYSIKNAGLFSRQAVLISLATIIPIITNFLGAFNIIPMSIYITPISFTFTIICLTLAMFRFNLFKIAPIALQSIVDRISASYVVLNDDYEISDFNETFIKTFHIKDFSKIRGASFIELIKSYKLNIDDFSNHIKKVENNDKTESFEIRINKIDKYFNIEITSIIIKGESLGILILFKDITQHKQDMQTIKDKQNLLIESERLASLGQLIGGIAHNLKTPIMSIAGASEGIKDLVNEFDASIGNPIVNDDDFHAIAGDMREWLDKINSYTEYMSDILTAVKGQAVNLSEQTQLDFTIGELFKRVNILMKHELKQAVVYLNMSMKVDENIIINGDVNSMVQVINNMISNSIQAYNGKPEQNIDMIAWKNDNNKIVITVKDYGPGLPDKVKNKLFKEIITTKGKNGTGLGLYMSYSTIRAHFNGDITVESEEGKGTTFNIILP